LGVPAALVLVTTGNNFSTVLVYFHHMKTTSNHKGRPDAMEFDIGSEWVVRGVRIPSAVWGVTLANGHCQGV